MGVDLIREAATKERIPIKVSSKKLTSKQSPTPVASSAGSSPRGQILGALFQALMGSREPSISPPPDRLPQSGSDGVERAHTQPIQSSPLPTLSGVDHTDEDSIVETGHSHGGPSTVTEDKADNRKDTRSKLDKIDNLMDGYLEAEKMNMKPAGEKVAKKAADIEQE